MTTDPTQAGAPESHVAPDRSPLRPSGGSEDHGVEAEPGRVPGADGGVTFDDAISLQVDVAPADVRDVAFDAGSEPGSTLIDVPIGRRVMVVSGLLLPTPTTPSSLRLTDELASVLRSWEGPGVLVVAGNLVDSSEDGKAGELRPRLEAHPRLRNALSDFLTVPDRQVIRQLGTRELPPIGGSTTMGFPEADATMGIEQAGSVDLLLHTARGDRRVRVESGGHSSPLITAEQADRLDPAVIPTSSHDERRSPWLVGLGRLVDPGSLPRFVTSRLLYRRFGRYIWWLLVPFALALLLRSDLVPMASAHLVRPNSAAGRALQHAQLADWTNRVLTAGLISLLLLALLLVLLGAISRKAWGDLGGGTLAGTPTAEAANGAWRDITRDLLSRGYDGLVSGSTLQPELTNLGTGFFASSGAVTEVVVEHHGRLGLPPVFLHHERLSWVELETGADLHVRLFLAQVDLPAGTVLERIVVRNRPHRNLKPEVVAAYPIGASWPPPPDLRLAHRRTRRARRWAGLAIFVAGALDLLSTVTPPLHSRLHVILQVLPLAATEAAGALVALAGLALVALARGILRGQRRAWRVSVALLTGTLFLHLVRGGDIGESLVALAVLVLLVRNRKDFQARSDSASLRSALLTLVAGTFVFTLASSFIIEMVLHFDRDEGDRSISWWLAIRATAERLVGIQTVLLPRRINDFLAPGLFALGVGLALTFLFLATRPVVDRRLTSGRAAEFRARDIVRRHGTGTLDYFALRSDKQWFFHRDNLIGYAIYGGICLVSPDPIGPENERIQAWDAFRRFADTQGWTVAVMGAAESWLPVYRDSGMHDIYVGDEAVVDVQRFSLAGNSMKGLRQANSRIGKYGYTATFHDPAEVRRNLAVELAELMTKSRHGEQERGFSMMLGRIFDPRDSGLLLTVVHAPDGKVAAMCQFVPAPAIDGYSLDLMRRDTDEHPNGLLDFALCATIEHLRELGYRGLSLNFAALRSVLAGETGDTLKSRTGRWVLKRMSAFVQIESLWKFNDKYRPDWIPRYVVFDTLEHLAPVAVAIMRAESLWEVPVIGKLLSIGASRRDVRARKGWQDHTDAGNGGPPIDPAVVLPPAGDGDRSDDGPTTASGSEIGGPARR